MRRSATARPLLSAPCLAGVLLACACTSLENPNDRAPAPDGGGDGAHDAGAGAAGTQGASGTGGGNPGGAGETAGNGGDAGHDGDAGGAQADSGDACPEVDGAPACGELEGCAQANGGCAQICIEGEDSHACACDISFLLEPDARSCLSRWSSPMMIETDDRGDANEPAVAVSESGHAIAVWSQYHPVGNDVIWASRYMPEVGFVAALPLEGEAGHSDQPRVAMDAMGNAVAVWRKSDGTRTNIWSNRYTVESGWEGPVLIEISDLGSASEPRIAMDAQGRAIAVWHEAQGGLRTDAWTNRFVPGSGWSGAATLEADAAADEADNPRIAMNAAGDAIVVWRQADGTRTDLWFKRSEAGSGWSAPALLEHDDTGPILEAEVTMNASGHAMAVWQQSDGTRPNLLASGFEPAAGWSDPARLESRASSVGNLAIAIDPMGSAIAVWSQEADGFSSIWANRFAAGTGWNGPALIESAGRGSMFHPQVGLDDAGNAVAVWEGRSDDATDDIWANRFLPESGWGDAFRIERQDDGEARMPRLAMTGAGVALAVWAQSDGTRLHGWAARFE